MRTERRVAYYVGVDNGEKTIDEIEEAFAFLEHFTKVIGSYVNYHEDKVNAVLEISKAFLLADNHSSVEIVYIYDMTPDEDDGRLVHQYEFQVYVHTDDDNDFYYSTKIRATANGEFTHEEKKAYGKEEEEED